MNKKLSIAEIYMNRVATAVFLICVTTTANAEVVLDGSAGQAGNIAGPNYDITSSLGQVKGNNLFHSFSTFDIANGETATFSGPSNVTNIFGRVTGESYSNIDGTLSSNIAGANLWLINPRGIVFGKNAKLDISGSFYASTADYIKFENGDRFNATTTDSILSVSNPTGFGFVKESPIGIATQQSSLKVNEGKQIVLAGGPVTLTGSTLEAASGRIDLVAVGGPGEVTLPNASDTARNINIAAETKREAVNLVDSHLKTIGANKGEIFLIGGRFYMNAGSSIEQQQNVASTGGIAIDVNASDTIIDGGYIISTNTAQGGSGSINIVSPKLTVRSNTDAEQRGRIVSSANGNGSVAGAITIKADESIELNHGEIATVASDSSQAGTINITSKQIAMLNDGQINSFNGSGGTGGTIKIDSTNIVLSGSSRINSEALNSDGSHIDITSSFVGVSDGSTITTTTKGTGKGGDIQIESTTMSMQSGSKISASSESNANAGNIGICATNQLKMDHSAITTNAPNAGGGNIFVGSDGGVVMIESQISASALPDVNGTSANVDVRACRVGTETGGNEGNLKSVVQSKSSITSNGGTTNLNSSSIIRSPDSIVSGSRGTSLEAQTVTMQNAKTQEEEEAKKPVEVRIALFVAPQPIFQSPCANSVLKPRGSFIAGSQLPLHRMPGDFIASSSHSNGISRVASATNSEIPNGCGE